MTRAFVGANICQRWPNRDEVDNVCLSTSLYANKQTFGGVRPSRFRNGSQPLHRDALSSTKRDTAWTSGAFARRERPNFAHLRTTNATPTTKSLLSGIFSDSWQRFGNGRSTS